MATVENGGISHEDEGLSELNPLSHDTVLLIHDLGYFIESWEKGLNLPGIKILKPEVPRAPGPEEAVIARQGLTKFFNEITDDNLAKTSLVVIDQFYDMPDMQYEAEIIIERLRELNSQAFIIESSGYPQDSIYKDSNVVVDLMTALDISRSLRNASPLPGVRLETVKMYSNESFMEALKYDPTEINYDLPEDPQDEFYSFSRISRAKESYQKLISTVEVNRLIELLDLDQKTLTDQFSQKKLSEKMYFLHYAWTFVGHLQLGNDESSYSGSITRLKQLLQTV